MSLTWTKSWSASNDGEVWGGNDVGTIQNDIDTYAVALAGSQTVTGNKTFSGAVVLSGAITAGSTVITDELPYLDNVATAIAGANEIVCYEDVVVSYEDNVVYYR